MNSAFADRMAELDALVERCRGRGPFATGQVRDTSNRTSRDWPWWSVEVTQTAVDGAENRRLTATITLNSTRTGDVGAFEAQWRAEIWRGVSPDSVDQRGSWPLAWGAPTPEMFEQAVEALLGAGRDALAQSAAPRARP